MNKQVSEEERYTRAMLKVKSIRRFYIHLAIYCVVMPFLGYRNYSESSAFFWSLFPLFGWGFGLLMHGFRVLGKTSKWEKRKIKEYINNENF